ncbi:hypothetical protein ACGFNU_37090 [Spirillospora sp. NPDC048911]
MRLDRRREAAAAERARLMSLLEQTQRHPGSWEEPRMDTAGQFM